ncbi:MAG: AAA family ATPase [Pirellulaceae bacterium]|nr:AAA family ATPase [Pirellulaceae bacterium]
MSYWHYWKLNAAPFTSSRQHFFRGQTVEEALARIEFVCGQKRNLATLLGPTGVGKSSLLNHLLSSPPRQSELPAPQICLVSMLGLSAGDLAIELAKKTCGRRMNSAMDAWNTLCDSFTTCQRTDAHTLLLIDDVENCGAEAENDLIRLVRLAEDKNVSIVLSIETHLASTVSRWLLERSYLQVELPLWDVQQAREFLRFTLSRCGGSTTLFTDSAVVRLHQLSRGTARRLVQLADLALIAGAVAGATRIDDPIIAQVAQEIPRTTSVAA